MNSLLSMIVLMAVILIVGFHVVVKIYQLFSGLDKVTATKDIQRFFRKIMRPDNIFWPNTDEEFIDGIRQHIIERYSSLSFDLSDGNWGISPEGVPFYQLQLICNEDQRPEIEAIMEKLLQRALSRYGYPPSKILLSWKSDGRIDRLEMRYSCNSEQALIIQKIIEAEKWQLAEESAPITDEVLESEIKNRV